ncbi:uncharacterized protein ACA1_365340 [Acanthamoeba castellanii str. Neff]|uniref:Uncharacterized protein n=1 Tax=Acanthamoeba castellanii (strain ATCC 30010 / Neff) TaxID=1257118 RepID=L8GPA3_ACACF|nr:uncharacterized protein ACA1_365340 [Acanthamoeba castellanii str. Neff]ELR13966.1 hypothetical protein ACA1_365340 [Acanthamoeba castellanii str. Neff]
MLRRSIAPVTGAGIQPATSSSCLVARTASAFVSSGSSQGQPILFKRNIQKYWSKEARQFKGKRPVKVMSIKRAARLAARRAAEEAEAAHLDSKYGTRCTSAFLAERVRWNEDYEVVDDAAEGPVISTPTEEPKKTKREVPIATGAQEEKPSFFARLFGRS